MLVLGKLINEAFLRKFSGFLIKIIKKKSLLTIIVRYL